jgi:hypothetical protein
MSRNRKTFILGILVLLVIGCFLIYKRSGRPREDREAEAEFREQSSTDETARKHRKPSQSVTGRSDTLPPDEKRRLTVEQKNVPVNFWGKIVDQSDVPVPAAEISLAVRHWEISSQITGASFLRHEIMSAEDGTFELLNSSGDVLTIERLAKTGYSVPPSALRSYGFNISTNVTVDREHPIIIRIWRKQTDQPLLKGKIFSRVIPDGRWYSVDLLKQTKSDGADATADLRIALQRPLNSTRRDRFDWSFSIEVPNGGILECREDTPFVAPETGYLSAVTTRIPPDDPNIKHFLKQKYYLKTRGGQLYGVTKVEISIVYDQNDAAFFFEYLVNPNSSPILQN